MEEKENEEKAQEKAVSEDEGKELKADISLIILFFSFLILIQLGYTIQISN